MRVEKTIKAYVPILLVMMFWGSMGIPSTYVLEEMNALTVLCFRSGIGAIVLLGAACLRHDTLMPVKGEGKLLIVLSFIGVVLCNYLYFFAVQNTSLTNVAVLYALGPIITTILAFFLLKEKVRQSRVIGIILAFGGVVILISKGHISELFFAGINIGDAAEMTSSFCLAVYTILSRKIKYTPANIVVFWLMFVSFVCTFPIVIFLEGGMDVFISVRAMVSLVYLGAICSGAGYLLQQKSIQRIGASASAAFLNGISPITVLTAAVILEEKITPVQAGGICIVFLGLFLNAKNKNLRSFLKKI